MSEHKPLGGLFTLDYGLALPAEQRSGHGYPVFGSSGQVGHHRDLAVRGPGIIVGRKGTVGSVTWSDDSFWPIDTAYFVRPTTALSLRWLYWLLKFLPLSNLDTSTGVPGLNRKDVAEISAFIPPLPEQRRISEILDTLDRTIEATQRIIEKLQATRQGLLHDLLTRGLDENGQLRDPERNPELFHETELGLLPREWEIQPLDTIATVSAGVTLGKNLSGSGTIELPYLRVANVQDGYLDLGEVKTIRVLAKDIDRYALQDGDVLMNEGGDLDKLGRGAVWRNHEGTFLHQNHVFKVRPQPHALVSEFLAFIGASPYGKRYFMGIGKQTTNLASINSTQLKAFPVPLPSFQEQEAIVSKLLTFAIKLKAEEARLSKLQALKRGLMEDLLNGRVRVPLVESDVEEGHADRVPESSVSVNPTDLPQYIPPQPPIAAHAPMYRAATGAQTKLTEWTQALAQAVQGQQVGRYSPEALDAVLPELLALTTDRRGVLQVPEVLAKAGIRFMLLPHPSGSRANGAAFYLDEEHTQPVVGLSLRYPYLDVFWFNLLHELAHIRLGHQPVPDESLEHYDQQSPDEQAANQWAQDKLIPPRMWQAFMNSEEQSIPKMRSFAKKLNRHLSIVAGRYGHATNDWSRVNPPNIRPGVQSELLELQKRLVGDD
ncbi:restriction endonuclease subunit S [Deinococcus radiophilus]|nr:restriction endonuclease subunit S [Deinococcus radiophilus]